MANHHLTGMLANNRHPVMPVQTGIQSPSTVMPAKLVPASGKRGAGIQSTPTVMPAEAGIHSSRTGHWIPADAGMTEGGRTHTFDAARLHAESGFEKYRRIQEAEYESDLDRMVKQATRATDAGDMAALERAERPLEGKGRGTKK